MEGVSGERCTLLGELMQVHEMARQLDAHMVGQLVAGGEERCRALVATMRVSIDRSVHIARSCCAEPTGRLPLPRQQPESPPSGDGSPLSAGTDQAGDFRSRGNAAGQYKKRKTQPKRSTQVRVSAVQDTTPLDDGLSWRKYGQKDILGAKYPRAYFRCTHRHTQGCLASKQVQRTDGDPLLFDVVYHGTHTCAQAAHAAAGAQHTGNQTTTTLPAEKFPPQQQPELELQATASPMFERTSSGFPTAGCIAASSFVPASAAQATPPESSQLVSSSSSNYTNSPMGDMDFIFPLDDVAADFLEDTISYDF